VSLAAVLDSELEALRAGGIAPVDIHAHTGEDIDGTRRSSEEHLATLERLDGRSAIFPLCVSGGYRSENLRVIEECRRHPDRLFPFARLDPRVDGAAEASTALEAGARGFKLHPRAEGFRLEHPAVEAIATVAAAARVPVLIHAGSGVGSFGPILVELAERHRGCPLILAHCGVSDLAWLAPVAAEHRNLLFDTSWWNPSDMLALFAMVPPGQILFGSDEPYMDFELVLAIALRCARATGLSEEALKLVFAAQAERLLAGEARLDAGPAPGAPARDAKPLDERLAALLAAAGGCMLGGGDPAQILELARGAVADGVGSAAVVALIDEAGTGARQAPWAVAMALTLALTPGVESPQPVG
jgi:predicted TIM-barrel fold metal-dependent hydrolase